MKERKEQYPLEIVLYGTIHLKDNKKNNEEEEIIIKTMIKIKSEERKVHLLLPRRQTNRENLPNRNKNMYRDRKRRK